MKICVKKKAKKMILLMITIISLMGATLVVNAAACPKGADHVIGNEVFTRTRTSYLGATYVVDYSAYYCGNDKTLIITLYRDDVVYIDEYNVYCKSCDQKIGVTTKSRVESEYRTESTMVNR